MGVGGTPAMGWITAVAGAAVLIGLLKVRGIFK